MANFLKSRTNDAKSRALVINSLLGVLIISVLFFGWIATHSSGNTVKFSTATVSTSDVVATVSASGTVVSPGDVGVSPSVAGQIKAINVKVGQKVKVGQSMGQIENSSLLNNLNIAKSNLMMDQITFKQDKASLQTALLNSQNNAITYKANIDAANASYKNDKINHDNYYATYSPAGYTVDYCSTLNLAGSSSSTITSVFSICQNILTNEKTIADDLAKIDAANLAQRVGVDKDQLALKSAQATLDLFKAQQGITTDNPTENDFPIANAAISVAQTSYNSSLLIAPVSGTVASINGSVGQIASTSTSSTVGSVTGFIVLTDVSGLQIKTGFSEIDAAKLKVGQVANISFSALSNSSATGKLLNLDLLPTTSNGAVSYGAYFSINSTDPVLKPGMTATVVVTTGQASQVLAVSSQAVTIRANGATVNLVSNSNGKKNLVSTPVTIGLQGDSLIQIISGLKEGDEVALKSISQNSSTGFPNNGGQRGIGVGGGLRVGG